MVILYQFLYILRHFKKRREFYFYFQIASWLAEQRRTSTTTTAKQAINLKPTKNFHLNQKFGNAPMNCLKKSSQINTSSVVSSNKPVQSVPVLQVSLICFFLISQN